MARPTAARPSIARVLADRLLDLMTMYLGPDRLIVAARVDFGGDISADQAEEIADEIDKRLADRLPQASHVFLDPTRRPSAAPQPVNAGKPGA